MEGGLGRYRPRALSPAETAPSSPHPLVPFSLWASLSNCCLCGGLQWNQQSMPALPRWLVSQSPRVFHLPLVSNPIFHRNSVQCGLVLPEQTSKAGCARVPEHIPLPAPLLFLLPAGWDGGRAGVPLSHSSATLPISEWSSLLLQVHMVCSEVFSLLSALDVLAVVTSSVCVRGKRYRSCLPTLPS